jgi:hypothetical protein
LRKKHGSSLDKGHYFVLAPLGGIGSCFRADKLIGVTLGHVDARPLPPPFCSTCTRNLLFAKLDALAGAAIGDFGVQIGRLMTLNQRVPGSSPGAPTKQIKDLAEILNQDEPAKVTGQVTGQRLSPAPTNKSAIYGPTRTFPIWSMAQPFWSKINIPAWRRVGRAAGFFDRQLHVFTAGHLGQLFGARSQLPALATLWPAW